MARAVISDPKRRAAYEPLYDIDPQTGDSVEIFYADPAVARSFGTSEAGWFWWTCHSGSLPHDLPNGPFANSYLAYRDVATRWTNTDGPRAFAPALESVILQCEYGHIADTPIY